MVVSLTIKIVNGVMLFSFRLQSVELSRFVDYGDSMAPLFHADSIGAA